MLVSHFSRALLVVAIGLVLVLGARPTPRAGADTTWLSVIACENLAPYLDGDAADATTAADEQAACLDPIPPTGTLSIASLGTALGDADGELTSNDFLELDPIDHNRIDPTCTYEAVVAQATKAAPGCVLLAFVFVEDEAPVSLEVESGLATIEGGGAADAQCTQEGLALSQDDDCLDPPLGNGDGVVVFHILNASASVGELKHATGVQENVAFPRAIELSTDSRNDPSVADDYDYDGVENAFDNCVTDANPDQANLDSQPIVTPNLPLDITVAGGDPLGDVCDPDIDNDGRRDFIEQFSNCFMTSTVPTLFDTDGDLVHDGAECAFGSNPRDFNSRPGLNGPDVDGDGMDAGQESHIGSNPNDSDSDDDRIPDGVEFKGYNTSPTSVDTDNDGCSDGIEIASFDRNTVVNSADLLFAAISFGLTNRPNIDVNKNGVVESSDLLLVAVLFHPFPCVKLD